MSLNLTDLEAEVLVSMVVFLQRILNSVIINRKEMFVILHIGDGGPFVGAVQLSFQDPALWQAARIILCLVASHQEIFLRDDRLGVVELNPACLEAPAVIVMCAPYSVRGIVHQTRPALAFSAGGISILSSSCGEAAESDVRARRRHGLNQKIQAFIQGKLVPVVRLEVEQQALSG